MVLNRIGLTGSSGLLGRHIIFILLKKKYNVIATSRTRPPLKHKMLIFKKLNLNEKLKNSKLDRIFGKISTLIHAGAYVPNNKKKMNRKLVLKCNSEATGKLAKWAYNRKVKFIYISGAIVYKNQNSENLEHSMVIKHSEDIYCYSKALSEKKLFFYKKQGLKLTIFRPSSIYGWGLNKSKIICKFLSFSKKNRTIKIYQPVNAKINLIHAYDVSSAIVQAIEKNFNGVLNIGYKTISFFELAKLAKKIFNNKKRIEILKKKKLFHPKRLDVGTSRIKKILNWKPKISLEKGLNLVIKKRCI